MDIEEILKKYEYKESNIIPILTEIQANDENHYISVDAINKVSEKLNISESKIYSVITFYSHLSSNKQGKNIIQVCSSITCHINGGVNVLEILKQELNISEGETTKDQLFTLELCSCLGCCDQAPVMRVNKKIYGQLDELKAKKIIKDYQEGEQI